MQFIINLSLSWMHIVDNVVIHMINEQMNGHCISKDMDRFDTTKQNTQGPFNMLTEHSTNRIQAQYKFNYYLYQAIWPSNKSCVFNIVWQKYLDVTNIVKILVGHYSKMAAKELKLQFP